jgi:hypothetical protein
MELTDTARTGSTLAKSSPRAFIPLIFNLVIGVDSTMSVIGLLHLQFLALWYAPVAFQLLCLPC